MEKKPERLEKFIRGMAALPAPLRPWAMNTEDPSGSYLPDTLASFIVKYREWWGPVSPDGIEGGGNMCIHLHKGFGLAEASVLAALGAGANGVWCGIAETGAAIGHACSAMTMTNMARYGNPLPGYNVSALRDAAIEITKITTKAPPPATTEVYGERANQWVFDFPGMGDDFLGSRWKFNMAGFLMVKKEVRIHTLATNAQFKKRLVEALGQDEWDDRVIANMRHIMLADLRENKKIQYQSPLEIACLYLRAGGRLPDAVKQECEAKLGEAACASMLTPALEGVKKQWDEAMPGSDSKSINYRHFYDLFLARIIPCYSCEHAASAWLFFETDAKGHLEWTTFLSWLHWCQLEFPDDTNTADGLIDTLFGKIMMPDLRRSFLLKCDKCECCFGVCKCENMKDLNDLFQSPLTTTELDAKLRGRIAAGKAAEDFLRGHQAGETQQGKQRQLESL